VWVAAPATDEMRTVTARRRTPGATVFGGPAATTTDPPSQAATAASAWTAATAPPNTAAASTTAPAPSPGASGGRYGAHLDSPPSVHPVSWTMAGARAWAAMRQKSGTVCGSGPCAAM
jgi:hypothetical protein